MANILVIDDDRSMRDLLRMHLTAQKHSVLIAANAEEAIRHMLARRPDLILSDVDMPYMSGLELLQAIKGDELTRHVPVVMLTSHRDDETWNRAMQLGAAQFLSKPVVLAELLKAVDSALGGKKRAT